MGLTRAQTLMRVELPLAVPAIVAGLRVATVTTISLATIAAFITPLGLGEIDETPPARCLSRI
jgi:osmoprotectant transport system permease protein